MQSRERCCRDYLGLTSRSFHKGVVDRLEGVRVIGALQTTVDVIETAVGSISRLGKCQLDLFMEHGHLRRGDLQAGTKRGVGQIGTFRKDGGPKRFEFEGRSFIECALWNAQFSSVGADHGATARADGSRPIGGYELAGAEIATLPF